MSPVGPLSSLTHPAGPNEPFVMSSLEAYQALNVPGPNVRILARDSAERLGNDHYHRSVVLSRETPRNTTGGAAYEDDWRFLLLSPD